MATYKEKLKDPRWQKRRLEVLERHNFTCEACGSKDTTLQVHHDAYVDGAEPWEHDDVVLRCFCEHCHNELHALERLAFVTMKVGRLYG